LVDWAIDEFLSKSVDYHSNTSPATFPDGLDFEVFTMSALKRAALESEDPFDREHVTPYLRKPGLFKNSTMVNGEDLSRLRWTVDELDDLVVISKVFQHFTPDIFFRGTKC
jgi:glutamate-1-semialdehyde 2,1-aminomutase